MPRLTLPSSAAPHRLPRTGNRAFCSEVTQWAFHERGVLRVTNLHHKCAMARA